MIDVYVRGVEQAEGQLLGQFTPSQVLELPNLFKTFETHVGDDGPAGFSHAQFVSTNGNGCYFEIVVDTVTE